MAEKIIKEIESKIESTKANRRANRINAYDFGIELLFKTKALVDQLKSLVGENNAKYQNSCDMLATEMLQCGIDYFKAIKSNSDFSESNSLEILNSAKSIAHNSQVLSRIEDNIKGIHDWVKNQAFHDSQSQIHDFNKILLKTAFSFMTCDGHIAPNEIALIRDMSEKENAFGEIDIDTELDFLIEVINSMGMGFLKDYLKVLKNANLSQDQELHLLDMALKTLYADGRVDYNEVKFFRVFRSILTVSDEQIRKSNPDLEDEFLESDIFSNAYLGQLFDEYFEKIEIPTFDKVAQKKHTHYVDPEEYKKH